MKTDTMTCVRINNEDIEIVSSICLLGSINQSTGTSSLEICYTLALNRVAMRTLERIFKCDATIMYLQRSE